MALESVYQTLMDNFVMYLGVIAALVAFFKEAFSLEGNKVRIMSFCIGLVVAGVFYAGYLFPVVGPYVEGLFFVIGAGLIASGFYDLTGQVAEGIRGWKSEELE